MLVSRTIHFLDYRVLRSCSTLHHRLWFGLLGLLSSRSASLQSLDLWELLTPFAIETPLWYGVCWRYPLWKNIKYSLHENAITRGVTYRFDRNASSFSCNSSIVFVAFESWIRYSSTSSRCFSWSSSISCSFFVLIISICLIARSARSFSRSFASVRTFPSTASNCVWNSASFCETTCSSCCW